MVEEMNNLCYMIPDHQDKHCHYHLKLCYNKMIDRDLHKGVILNFQDVIVGEIKKDVIMGDLGIRMAINVQVVVEVDVINHEIEVEIGIEVGTIEIEIVIGIVIEANGILIDHHIQI